MAEASGDEGGPAMLARLERSRPRPTFGRRREELQELRYPARENQRNAEPAPLRPGARRDRAKPVEQQTEALVGTMHDVPQDSLAFDAGELTVRQLEGDPPVPVRSDQPARIPDGCASTTKPPQHFLDELFVLHTNLSRNRVLHDLRGRAMRPLCPRYVSGPGIARNARRAESTLDSLQKRLQACTPPRIVNRDDRIPLPLDVPGQRDRGPGRG